MACLALSVVIEGRNVLGKILFVVLLLVSIALGAFTGLFIVYKSDLPQVQELEDYRPNVITELYSDDGRVIGSFALERRIVVSYEQIPKLLREAIIATEDQHFETHWGVDFFGIARALFKDMIALRKAEGASTLTQQLSRLCFLTPEKSFKRKFQEILFSIQIERYYTKPQIMTLYCNQVYLGHGTYGFEAAAQYYFSKTLKDLRLEEIALLAALPRNHVYYSPINNPENARRRRDHVIDRIAKEDKISPVVAEMAKKAPLTLSVSSRQNTLAPYFGEEIRKYLEQKYGSEAVHEKGLRVYTTLNIEMQQAANEALKEGLEDFDKRHGWRGVNSNILKQKVGTVENYEHEDWKRPPVPGNRITGLVISVKPKSALIKFGKYAAQITEQNIAWIGKRSLAKTFSPGDLALFKVLNVDLSKKQLRVELDQRPLVQGGLVVIESSSGEIKAMVGGYDFESSKFNRATQAYRQTGSAFKPFVYTMALDQGMLPTDTILDSPVSFPSGQGQWSPQNYDHKFEGVITLRRALAQSRNVPAVKLLSQFGVEKGIEYVRKFGVTSPNLAPYLPLALGSAEITLLEMASAYTVFPNDGVRILPRFIKRVTDYVGEVREENHVEVREVVSQATARAMVELLRGVVEFGTAQKAKMLKRPVAGKTGTTNDYTDAWFIGFTPSITCGVWVGYDQKKSLGKGEVGARAALPIWIDFIQQVTRNKPPEEFAGLRAPERKPLEKLDTVDDAAGDGEMSPE
ncbi:MAG: penicillin-binding protein [Acidobacteria bacterium]|nr:MAG: penicillin-binding protein [Acidobacteriota bacterium]